MPVHEARVVVDQIDIGQPVDIVEPLGLGRLHVERKGLEVELRTRVAAGKRLEAPPVQFFGPGAGNLVLALDFG